MQTFMDTSPDTRGPPYLYKPNFYNSGSYFEIKPVLTEILQIKDCSFM